MPTLQPIEMKANTPFSITAQDGMCRIFTHAEGVLSPMAHDLVIRVEGISLTLNPGASNVLFSFDVSTLRVDGAFDARRQRIDAVAKRDRKKIEGRIKDEVLAMRRFAECTFTLDAVKVAETNTFDIHGVLELRGIQKALSATVDHGDGLLKARIQIGLSDYGIPPVTALFGALRVKDAIEVEFQLNSRHGEGIKETLAMDRR